MDVSGYNSLKTGALTSLEIYIDGLSAGIEMSNIAISQMHEVNVFCPPETITLNTGNYMDIIDKEIKSNKYEEDAPIEGVLFFGLIKTFPCK